MSRLGVPTPTHPITGEPKRAKEPKKFWFDKGTRYRVRLTTGSVDHRIETTIEGVYEGPEFTASRRLVHRFRRGDSQWTLVPPDDILHAEKVPANENLGYVPACRVLSDGNGHFTGVAVCNCGPEDESWVPSDDCPCHGAQA